MPTETAPLGPVVDHGDGRYTRSFQAPAVAGVYTPDVSLQGSTLLTTVSLDAAGSANHNPPSR